MSQEFPGPPVTQLGMLSIGLVAAGVIDLAAYMPRRAPLLPPTLLFAAAAAVLAVNVLLIVRQRGFALWRFRQVVGWMLISVSLPRLPAALTSVILLIQPVSSVALAALILSERPSAPD